MGIRHTRLIALLMLITITVVAVGSVLWLGSDAPFIMLHQGRPLSTKTAALSLTGYALAASAMFEAAARVRRWRRNIVRAGGPFAVGWIGSLSLILARQLIGLTESAGRPIDPHTAYAAVVGAVVLLKANMLPKSRPAWFNGTTLPLFASELETWRTVHRASALRLAILGLTIMLAAMFGPRGFDPLRIAVPLMLAEITLCSLHGLWLGHKRRRLLRSRDNSRVSRSW